jgi:hypothetical protein
VSRSSWAVPVAYTRHVRNEYKILVNLKGRDYGEDYDINGRNSIKCTGAVVWTATIWYGTQTDVQIL